MTVLDLFAGPGGWDKGAEDLGLRPIGIEKDEWACKTRACAGLLTIRADVTTLDPGSFGIVDGLIASPPCPDFSVAGRRAGIEGETGQLMWEVPRWVKALGPRWVACEQVPPALPWWRIFAEEFRAIGYKTWCGVLMAANYGTPQARARAFLLAHREKQPVPPAPTHTEFAGAPLFGGKLLAWVSMAEALGWAEGSRVRTLANTELGAGVVMPYERSADRPAPVVLGNAGRWRMRSRNSTKGGTRPGGLTRSLNKSALTVDGSSTQWVFERPATTVEGTPRVAPPGHHDRQWEGSIAVTLPELGVLQDFPLDHPWQGNKTRVASQIGNAVPVRLARAVLEAVTK